jgi:hypothetical protein
MHKCLLHFIGNPVVKEPIPQPEAPVQEVDQGTPAGIELVDPTGE